MALPDLQGALWAWVQALPPWQSDLLRRLTTLEDVPQEALDDAVSMVLTAFDLPQNPPVAAVPIPALVASSSHRATQILALFDLVRVGSVEVGQRLDFGPIGLTVVFGETGSGKSSYVRVLRKACRSSAKPIEILPNVLKSGPAVGAAQAGTARIEMTIDGVPSVIERDVNAAAEPELAEVSVFDKDCATVYTEGESEITYTPSSLRLLERLAGFQSQIKKRIEEEIAILDAERVPTDGFDANTKSGALVNALTENVSPATVDALASVSGTEKKRLDKLRAQIAEATASDPIGLAVQLERRAAAAEELVGHLDGMRAALEQRTVDELLVVNGKAAELTMRSAQLSAALSKASARAIGSPAWKALWQAAHVYVGKHESFPPRESGTLCPLCQQALSDEALERLRRFEVFYRGEVERALGEIAARRGSILELMAKLLAGTKTVAGHAGLVLNGEPALETVVMTFLASVAARTSAIQLSISATKIDAPPLAPEPTTQVRSFAANLRSRAAEHRALAVPDALRKLAREIAELEDRLRLADRRVAVVARIHALKRIALLRGASSALATTGLSRKIGEFTEGAVTAQLRGRLATELEALRCTHLPVAIGARGTKGKTRLSLQLDTTRHVGVGEVLSDGERRAVSLAFFLAEVAVAEHGGGIVLDDPVSSLDHARRTYVAQRLIDEATSRQTIVFTHDIVFLLELQELAARVSVPYEVRVVRRVGNTAGIAARDLPWVAQNVKMRIGFLRGEMQRLAALEHKGDEESYRREVKTWFELLREAWERTVEEKLFNGVVGRFQPSIQTLRLRPVTVTQAMTTAVEHGMTRASAWTHDQAPALGKPPPTATDLRNALEELDTFVEQFRG
jgi:AAA domain-containing protein